MNRLLFEKTGSAVYISHLDLMRVFQRAFRRAGFLLKHTGGFNQHAYVSLALPLSVGTASVCEILDYEMDTDCGGNALRDALNQVLPAGIRVLSAYESNRKLKELTTLRAEVFLEYDAGVPEEAEAELEALFARDTLTITKHGKHGDSEVDLHPMLRSVSVQREDANTVRLEAEVSAQNPSLNPMLLPSAIERYLPSMKPDFSRCRRLEVLDVSGKPFR